MKKITSKIETVETTLTMSDGSEICLFVDPESGDVDQVIDPITGSIIDKSGVPEQLDRNWEALPEFVTLWNDPDHPCWQFASEGLDYSIL